MNNFQEKIKERIGKLEAKLEQSIRQVEKISQKSIYNRRLLAISGKLPYNYAKKVVSISPQHTESDVYMVARGQSYNEDILLLLEQITEEHAKELSQWVKAKAE